MRLTKKSQRGEALARVPSFQGLTQRELAALARLSEEVEVPAGKVLARRGEPGHELLVILEGTASVELENGRRVRMGAGDFVGEMSLLDGEPRSATVIAETPMRVLAIAHRDFWSLLYQVPQIGRKIMVALSQRLRRASKPVG